MMRRYEDAIKVFVDALIYNQRTRTMFQSPTRSLLSDMVRVFILSNLSSLLFTYITLYNYRIDHQAKRANLVPSRHRAQLLPDANRRLDQLASQGEVRREANQATKRVVI